MIADKIIFEVTERENTFCKSGKEWALKAAFVEDGGMPLTSRWTLHTWKTKPKQEKVDELKKIVLRGFEFYHRHLHIPQFNLTEVHTRYK